MLTMSIADNLPRLRKAKGLSQVALANKAGVSQQLISRLESGVDLTSKKLPELARALEVSVYEIDEAYTPDAIKDPIETDAEILAFLARITDLSDTDIGVAFAVIQNARSLKQGGSKQPGSHDLPQPASPHHGSEPSRSKSVQRTS